MIALKLSRVGSAVVVILPTEALAKLGVGEGDVVYLAEAIDGFRLIPHDADIAQKLETAEEGLRAYRTTLQALAP